MPFKSSVLAEAYHSLEEKHHHISEQKKELQFSFVENPDDENIKEQIQVLNQEEIDNREDAKEIILKAGPKTRG